MVSNRKKPYDNEHESKKKAFSSRSYGTEKGIRNVKLKVVNPCQVSLSDLPNELLLRIVTKLDFRARIRLALNKRLDQFLATVPNEIDKMCLEVGPF